MFQTKKQLKLLDFDIENRPLSYWYEGKPTAEITAIASCWVGNIGSMEVKLLGRDAPKDILEHFVERYNEADIVIGHSIRRHDLPNINGALLEYGLPQLGPKMTSDTRWDLSKKGDIPATQEYLVELFGLPFEKYHMSQVKWRKSNRLLGYGLEETERRVTSDVYQNILLREHMLKHGLLKSPKLWRG